MKKKYLYVDIIEFFLIFFVFIMPSLTITTQETVTFTIYHDAYFIIVRLCALIYFIISLYDKGIGFVQQWSFTFLSALRTFLESIQIYVYLLIVGILFNIVGNLTGVHGPSLYATAPQTFFTWVWFIFSVIVLACFEESLYRQFIPEKLHMLVRTCLGERELGKKTKRILTTTIETVTLLLFALGHFYLGFLSVITSFLSACIFRYATIKYKSILRSCIAHSINNLVSFFVLFHFSS